MMSTMIATITQPLVTCFESLPYRLAIAAKSTIVAKPAIAIATHALVACFFLYFSSVLALNTSIHPYSFLFLVKQNTNIKAYIHTNLTKLNASKTKNAH